MNTIKISEVEEIIRETFTDEESLVNTITSVYEKNEDDDFYKLIISIHGLSTSTTMIIHTKFIFYCDLEKVNLVKNNFSYLYDINCVYKHIDFDSLIDIRESIISILDGNKFGDDIIILSDFIEAPSMLINHYLTEEEITDFSVFDVEYVPKFKVTPCDKITFDFKINVNNNYDIDLSLKKVDDEYRLQFKMLDDIETVVVESIKDLHTVIGFNLATLLNLKLKNK